MYFDKCKTLEEVKATYKKLVFQLHPDVSGRDTTAEFQQMQNEYEKAFAACKNIHRNAEGGIYEKSTDETPEEFRDIINQLIKMPGVVIEIIGSFIWLSGETKVHKEEIKQLGFRWAKNKKMWYKSPEGYHKISKKDYGIEDIRNIFGSKVVSADPFEKRKMIAGF